MQPLCLPNTPQTLAAMALLLCSCPVLAVNAWNYQRETDVVNNQTYSVAMSPMPRRDLYDELKLEVVCRNRQLQVDLTADNLIASQGSQFDISYQIDQTPPVGLQMTTFPDSKRKGYTDTDAQTLIKAMLAGKESIFLKVLTMTRKELAGSIPLAGASEVLQKVVSDCAAGAAIAAADPHPKPLETAADYDFKTFQQDFNKLSVGQQRQLLSQIKQLLEDMR